MNGPLTGSTTGRIMEALAALDDLDEVDVAEHPARFDALHQALREELAGARGDG